MILYSLQNRPIKIKSGDNVIETQLAITYISPIFQLGSPVRVFTTLNLESISLPENRYKFCVKCNIWVSKLSQHCDKCNTCVSKNGGAYWHCNKCQRCVKSTWKHCKKCKRCALPEHPCKFYSKKKP